MADLSLPITYNSLSINTVARTAGGAPMSGYLVDEFDYSRIDVSQKLDKKAIADGLDAQDLYLGGRHISMIVSVYGSTKGDFWDKAQDLLTAFSPTLAYSALSQALGFLPLDFYQPTADIVTWPLSAYPNGLPLRFYARPFATPAYVARRDEQGGLSGKGISKQFRISLLARDPRKVAQAISSTSSTSTLTMKGDYPAIGYVSITASTATGTWVGTLNGSSWTVNVDGSKITTAGAFFQAQSRWMLDCNRQILYGPDTSGTFNGNYNDGLTQSVSSPEFWTGLVPRMDRWAAGSAFPLLSPGTNSMALGGGSLAPTTTIVKWRDAFA